MKSKTAKFPLPRAIELATLAAILRPKGPAVNALKIAMEFYLEAILFRLKCTAMSLEDLTEEFCGEQRWLSSRHEQTINALQPWWDDALELDPAKPTDEARDFVDQYGVKLKTARAVLNNIRKAAGIREHKTSSRPKKTYIPRFILEDAVDYVKEHRRESKRKSWRTRKAARRRVQKTVK